MLPSHSLSFSYFFLVDAAFPDVAVTADTAVAFGLSTACFFFLSLLGFLSPILRHLFPLDDIKKAPLIKSDFLYVISCHAVSLHFPVFGGYL